MTKEILKEFALNEDYAFVFNAGIQYVDSQAAREYIAECIENADLIEEAECADLDEEAQNGCTIYKVSGNNIDTMYIAYNE